MVRVTIVCPPGSGKSGIGEYFEQIAPHVPDELTYVTLPHGEFNPYTNNPLSYLRTAIAAATSDTDVIHVQHEYGLFGSFSLMSWLFFPVLYVFSQLRGIPVIVTVHESLNQSHISGRLRLLKRAYLLCLNMCLAITASRLVFLSDNGASKFRASVPVKNYSVFPHGVTTTGKRDVSKRVARAELDYDEDDVIVAAVGYVARWKGSDLLVDLARRRPDIEFLLAGGPPNDSQREYFERIRRDAPPNLTVTGRLPFDAFQAAFIAPDLVLLPYRRVEHGGIINSVNQSGILNWCAAYAKPVVASDFRYFTKLKSAWDCVETAGEDDVDAFENRMIELLSDPERAEELRQGMREYAEAHSFEQVGRVHHDLYVDSVAKPADSGVPGPIRI